MKGKISTEEAAAILGVSVQRVAALCRAEAAQAGTGLRAQKSPFGGPWMVDPASVQEYKSRPETRGRKRKVNPVGEK